MLWIRCFQIRLRSWWDFRDEFLRIPWDPLYQEDPLWWSWAIQQRVGVDLSLPVPDLSFYSDESDVGWGVIVGEHEVSGVWSPSQKGTLHHPQGDDGSPRWPLRVQLSSQRRDDRSLLRLCHDSRLPQAIRRHEVSGPVPRSEGILLWVESMKIMLLPQLIQGSLITRADLLSRPNLVIGSEWTLHQEVAQDPSSPVTGDHSPVRYIAVSKAPCVLCSSMETPGSGGRCIPLASGQPPGICLPAHCHHIESSSQPESLSHLRSHPDRPLLASKRMVSSCTGPSIRHSNRTTLTSGSAATPHFHRSQDNLPLLRLTAWRLSSDSPVRHASLRQWLAVLPSVGEILD